MLGQRVHPGQEIGGGGALLFRPGAVRDPGGTEVHQARQVPCPGHRQHRPGRGHVPRRGHLEPDAGRQDGLHRRLLPPGALEPARRVPGHHVLAGPGAGVVPFQFQAPLHHRGRRARDRSQGHRHVLRPAEHGQRVPDPLPCRPQVQPLGRPAAVPGVPQDRPAGRREDQGARGEDPGGEQGGGQQQRAAAKRPALPAGQLLERRRVPGRGRHHPVVAVPERRVGVHVPVQRLPGHPAGGQGAPAAGGLALQGVPYRAVQAGCGDECHGQGERRHGGSSREPATQRQQGLRSLASLANACSIPRSPSVSGAGGDAGGWLTFVCAGLPRPFSCYWCDRCPFLVTGSVTLRKVGSRYRASLSNTYPEKPA